MGKSGSWKTTLARIISGYLMPEKGEVLHDGTLLKPGGFSFLFSLFTSILNLL
jgi:ABC-type bacteriocin/lantibiotic exporter with double-glycine peptidase domain